MRSIRRALAVTLVATALCADRAVAASSSPSRAEPVANTSRTLVARLGVSLRRCLPAVRFVESRRDQDRPPVLATPVAVQPCINPISLSPFEFRLPPPAA